MQELARERTGLGEAEPGGEGHETRGKALPTRQTAKPPQGRLPRHGEVATRKESTAKGPLIFFLPCTTRVHTGHNVRGAAARAWGLR